MEKFANTFLGVRFLTMVIPNLHFLWYTKIHIGFGTGKDVKKLTYALNAACLGECFSIPCEVVDKHLNSAPFKAISILLYIFRNRLQAINVQDISKALFLNETVVQQALDYWVQNAILTVVQQPGASVLQPVADAAQPIQTQPHYVPQPKPSAQEILQLTANDPDLRYLLANAPTVLGRLLTSSDTSTLVWLYHYAGMSSDIILMVIEFCAAIGKKNMRFIEKQALKWVEKGIDSHEKAENYIKQAMAFSKYEALVQKAFGIYNRSFTPKEKEYIHTWFETFGFDIQMVTAAYERTVDRTGKVSFPYMHSILTSWHQKGYRTPADTQKEAPPPKKNAGNRQASYDLEAFDDLALFNRPSKDRT